MDRNLRIRMLLEASDRVTRPLKDIAGGGRAAAGALKGTRDRLRELERAQSDISSFRKLKGELRGTETELEAAQAKVTALARAMRDTANPSRQLVRDFEKAKRAAAQLGDEHRRQGQDLQQLRDRLRGAGVGTSELARHERELRGAIERTNRELTEQADRLGRAEARAGRFAAAKDRFGRVQGMATGLAAGGAASIATGLTLARPITGAVEDARGFESVMTDIAQKANLSRVQAAAMGRELLVGSRAANQLPEALQQGVDTLSGFGLDPRRAVAMMRPIGRAATAYKAEIADLSAAAFAANDNLKVPIEQTGRVIDVMAQAGKAGAFEIKDMAGAFPSLTAGYHALGQTGVGAVADLAAALQIARKGAGDSATAANNVANLIQKISSPLTIKQFKKFGIDLPAALKKAYAEGKTPLEAIAELTARATKGDLGKLGFLFEDSQVQQGLRPLIQNLEEYRRIRAEAAGASGTTDVDFAERLRDSAEQAKRLKIQATTLAIGMGSMLLPAVNAVTARAGAFADRLSALTQRHPRLATAVAIGAALFAALFVVLGGGAVVVAGLIAPFAALSFAAGALGIGLLPVIGIAAGVVAGVVALGAAAYLIYSNWGPITAWFGRLWQGLKNIVAGALAWFGALPSRFAEFGRNMIMGLIRGITGMLGQLKSTVVGAAGSAAAWFKQKLGIRSPSRVFAGFGGFMMQGLARGIDRDAERPVRRVDAVSRRLLAAMAAGSAMPALAMPAITSAAPIATRSRELQAQIVSSPRPVPSAGDIRAGQGRSPGAGSRPAPAGDTYHVHFHPSAGMDEARLFTLFEQWHRRQAGRAAADRRATYRDDADGADR